MSSGLHARNKHQGRYDFKRLVQKCPELRHRIAPGPHRELTIDFSDPTSVRLLNKALLKDYYDLDFWDIPDGFLCPPIPGRSDYIHNAADLLASCNRGEIPRGPGTRVLDVGTGASCIYPIIGNREYGWSFVGSDVDPAALSSARLIARSNKSLRDHIEIRKQESPEKIFKDLVLPGEHFDLTVCNPPFHGSLREAQEGSRRKWKNLGVSTARNPALNFGGKSSELWCPGGESGFIARMIAESVSFSEQVSWFSTLVSKGDALPGIYRRLKQARVSDVRTIEMAQGQKKSRLVAWTFRNASG